ncbi:MAG: aminotransferase class I/II-fold pyridoxal phosphate-dependent enzyme [Candidatus Krumholzibacteriota bacterium]|nr:aminotransferase class I/II-fold pyridoxal phosphate-dependent enzyme [Candidatus Krumholzibacteriota bacterium]
MQSTRLGELPPYLFIEIDKRREEFIRGGRRVLDLGIGDPDGGAPPDLVRRLVEALEEREVHRYPSGTGHPGLVDAIRDWAGRYHQVSLDPAEILVTIGSKEAIAHLPLAVVNPGEVVLIPDPGYPVYNAAAVFAGAKPHLMPLFEENSFWPDLSSLDATLSARAKLLFLNYPNNPTTAAGEDGRFREVIDFCGRNDIILVNDAAYSEIYYQQRPPSLFPLARETGNPYIEFFSFSKTFSITGWRIGFAVGSRSVIAALARLKGNIDSGVFTALQQAVAGTLRHDYREITSRTRSVFKQRRDMLAASLRRAGFSFSPPRATFYFWIKTPASTGSVDFCRRLLEDTGIVATPGVGFGRYGEGYFRLSITSSVDTIREAGMKLEEYSSSF